MEILYLLYIYYTCAGCLSAGWISVFCPSVWSCLAGWLLVVCLSAVSDSSQSPTTRILILLLKYTAYCPFFSPIPVFITPLGGSNKPMLSYISSLLETHSLGILGALTKLFPLHNSLDFNYYWNKWLVSLLLSTPCS